jgi:gamma-butyrobetaine dioxygenase
MTARVEVLDGGRRVRFVGPDGEASTLSSRWLFDHSLEAREPESGQRRHGALALADATVVRAFVVDDQMELEFQEGRRTLPLSRLDDVDWDGEIGLWATPEAMGELEPIPFDAYLASDADLAEALTRLNCYGLVLLTGAGDDPDAAERAVGRFGYIRETNYGRLFDVKVEAEPGNFAFTERALDLHTDNPYRDPVPTLQILHAIRADAGGGGETAFVDGFAHAEAFRREAPWAFDMLAREPVRFTFSDASGARWSARAPVLETDAEGRVSAIRVNHRSLDLEPREAARQDAWYDAYLDLYRRLHAPEAALERRLESGELVLFDNRRILHGRRAHDRSGARWLRGAYADVDGLYATLARLQR